jgi:Mn2+/Fe2+ NRAMP family transporter
VLSGKYWTFEKATLVFCVFNLVYIPAALWAMHTPTAPGWGKVFEGFYRPHGIGFSGEVLFFLLANIGTTIAPWQIFFQQSAVVDKGLDVKDIKFGKWDTLAGATLTCIVAVFIIIVTGAAFYYHRPPIVIEDARQTAEALVPLLPAAQGALARKLFAIGLFDAGFLGALCISLSSSWALGEVFGWAHSLNASVRDAPWFYLFYLGMLLTAGAVVVIPDAPLVTITMFVQVVAVTLLPSLLVFLLLMLNDKGTMGEYVNTRWQNFANGSIVALVIVMSTLLGIQTLYPELFR